MYAHNQTTAQEAISTTTYVESTVDQLALITNIAMQARPEVHVPHTKSVIFIRLVLGCINAEFSK